MTHDIRCVGYVTPTNTSNPAVETAVHPLPLRSLRPGLKEVAPLGRGRAYHGVETRACIPAPLRGCNDSRTGPVVPGAEAPGFIPAPLRGMRGNPEVSLPTTATQGGPGCEQPSLSTCRRLLFLRFEESVS